MEPALLSHMGVYKANQCTDVTDCIIALEKLEEIYSYSRTLGFYMYMRRRRSLQKKLEQLAKKQDKLEQLAKKQD